MQFTPARNPNLCHRHECLKSQLAFLPSTILQLCHLPPPVLPLVNNFSCLLTGRQPLEASCCTILLFFWRYRTAGWKMFSLFFVLVFFMDYLCEKCHRPSAIPYYIAVCVSWVPRLTLLDSWTNWDHKHALQMEHICSQGIYCKHLLSSIQEKTNVWSIVRSVWEQLDFIYLKVFFFLKSLLNLLQCSFCFMFWFFSIWGLSSPTRDQTHTPCPGTWSLNYQTTREVLERVGF